jgi:hypothetical protein
MRKGIGFSLSSSYVAPHCGHFSAFAARDESDWDVCIHCRRQDSWAMSVPVHGVKTYYYLSSSDTTHSCTDVSMPEEDSPDRPSGLPPGICSTFLSGKRVRYADGLHRRRAHLQVIESRHPLCWLGHSSWLKVTVCVYGCNISRLPPDANNATYPAFVISCSFLSYFHLIFYHFRNAPHSVR